jgi:predicted SnoaL-like aldol condensation-catalyzing enzyme
MLIETQKNIVNQYFQGLMDGRLEILEEILSSDCAYIDAGETMFTNRGELIDYLRKARRLHTKFDVVISDIIAEGDKAAVRCTFHLDTNAVQTTLAVMGFFQFHAGKIVKIWRSIVIRDEQEKISSYRSYTLFHDL